MRVYLAGKIEPMDWRHDLVANLRNMMTSGEECAALFQNPTYVWPILRNAILGQHHYTGPYFISCDHGCAHGPNTHGVAISEGPPLPDEKHYLTAEELADWQADAPTEIEQDERGYYVWFYDSFNGCLGDIGVRQTHVLRLCRNAIEQSDLVFAWIDRTDLYGTLVELGYAKGIGRKIWVAGPERFSDLWFAYQIADKVAIPQPDAVTAFSTLLGRRGEYVVPEGATRGACRWCRKPVIWTKNENGKNIPLDLATCEERDGTTFALIHFAVCKAIQ